MKTAVRVCAIVAFLFGLGACSDDGSALSDAAQPGDGAGSDASTDDAPTGDAPAVDAPAGGQYCPVVGYSACGGDILGTWGMRALCPEDPAAAAALCEHPYDNRTVCTGTGNEATCDGSVSGTLTFKADGTVEIDTQLTLVTSYNFTDECLAAAITTGTTAEERCLSMTKADKLTCSYNARCTCVSAPMVESDKKTGTYKIEGQDLTLGEDPPASYCVDGDRLTMDYYVFHPVSWRYWVLERE
jgi:hypothetical protein